MREVLSRGESVRCGRSVASVFVGWCGWGWRMAAVLWWVGGSFWRRGRIRVRRMEMLRWGGRWVGLMGLLGLCAGWVACVADPSANSNEQSHADGGPTGATFSGRWEGLVSKVEIGGAERGYSEIRSMVATKQGHYVWVVPSGILNAPYRFLHYPSGQDAPVVIPTPVDTEAVSYVGWPDTSVDADDTILYAFPFPALRIFLFAKGTFTTIPKPPAKTFDYPKFLLHNGKVYASGVGENAEVYVYVYDGKVWQMLGEKPIGYTIKQPVQSFLGASSGKLYLLHTFTATAGDPRFFFRFSVWDGSAWKDIAVPGINEQMDASLTTFEMSIDPKGTQIALVQTDYRTGETQIKRYTLASAQWIVTTLAGKNDSQHTAFHRYFHFDPDVADRFYILKMRQPNNIPQNQVLESILQFDGEKQSRSAAWTADQDLLFDPLLMVWPAPTKSQWVFGFNYGARPYSARCVRFTKSF